MTPETISAWLAGQPLPAPPEHFDELSVIDLAAALTGMDGAEVQDWLFASSRDAIGRWHADRSPANAEEALRAAWLFHEYTRLG
jgi:hypothetical protein